MKNLCIAFLTALLLTPSVIAQDEIIKVACVGDSITYGHGARTRKTSSYPVQLQKLLGETHKVMNFGHSARTLLKKGDRPYWNEETYQRALASEPDIVIIKLGTNDAKNKNWQHKADFAADLTEFAQSFKNLPSKPIVYLAIPVPVEKSKWSISDENVREMIPIIKEVAKQTDCPVIDFYSALPKGENLSGDGIHPNNAGYKRMAETAYSALTEQNPPATKK